MHTIVAACFLVFAAPDEPTTGSARFYEDGSGWELGATLAFGLGTKQSTGFLERQVNRQYVIRDGGRTSVEFGDQAVDGTPLTITITADQAVNEAFTFGVHAGVFLWDSRLPPSFKAELQQHPTVPYDEDASTVHLRLGPAARAQVALTTDLAAQLSAGAGYWLNPSNTESQGLYLRPAVGLSYKIIDSLVAAVDAGYAMAVKLDTNLDPIKGFELQIGARWIL